MKLWTIQHEGAWRKARRTGFLRADGRRHWSHFREPYLWMAAEMRRRLSEPPRGIRYPVWAWAQYDGERKRRPDLRKSGHLCSEAAGFLIEFEAWEHEVLLSDFELWHYVLNRSYLPQELREIEDDQSPPTRFARRRMEKSWERIFDLDWYLEDVSVERSQRSIQATVWQVPVSMVISATPFRAR